MHLLHPRFLLLFLLSIPSIWTFGGNTQNPKSIDWQADLDFLAHELPKNHPDLFFKIPKDTFLKEISELKKEIPALSNTEITLRIQKILAKMGDDHTNVDFIPLIIHDGVLPLKFQWFPEGIFIMQAQNPYGEILGHKLVAVNGVPADTLFRNISGLLPAGNASVHKQRVPFLMSFRAILNYECSLNPQTSQPFKMRYEDEKGQRKTVLITPSNQPTNITNELHTLKPETGKIPLSMQHPQKLFWLKHLPQDSMLFIQYNRCTSREVEKKWGSKELASRMPSFRKFAKDIFQHLNQHKISRVVIDLRQNPGGSSPQGTELAALMGRWKEQNPGCRFFVLAGKRTYSSAIINTMDFKRYTDATVVGEPTSGSPNHFGEIRMLKLPSSGLQISHSTKFFKLIEQDINTLKPDIQIMQTFEDYRNGIDPVLEAVKSY